MNPDLYFKHLPDELIREILYNLSDYDSFNHLYDTNYNFINKILDDYYFWKYLINAKIGKLSQYIIPLENKSTNIIKKFNFLYRLIYYIRCMNSYIESIKIFNNSQNALSRIIKKYFPSGKIPFVDDVSKDIYDELPKIILDGRFLTDFSLLFSGIKVMNDDLIYKLLSDSINITRMTALPSIGNIFIVFFQIGQYEDRSIMNREEFLALLFHIHF